MVQPWLAVAGLAGGFETKVVLASEYISVLCKKLERISNLKLKELPGITRSSMSRWLDTAAHRLRWISLWEGKTCAQTSEILSLASSFSISE
jgi:hypothetical protein